MGDASHTVHTTRSNNETKPQSGDDVKRAREFADEVHEPGLNVTDSADTSQD